ncbi:hypothetical protein CXF43_08635 [Corynebacterium bovis]|nr:hypothetical protein CXF32_01780 [Corynebacterium bovis]RRQ00711.1 hypothetical protein CXF31_00305 [Corynebacterium bovis]RRQ06484.1 hypothetical protein CXF43_08635 [Corynebacterium bovis]RRQ09523.1 hypothetical protein CXF44_07765 [Corynebacterium bovis]
MMVVFTIYCWVWVVLSLWLAVRKRKWWIFPLGVLFGPALGFFLFFGLCLAGPGYRNSPMIHGRRS